MSSRTIFDLYLGDGPVEIHVPVTEDDGRPKDLTGAGAAFFWLYSSSSIATPELTKVLGDGVTIPTPADDGVVVATLSVEDVETLSANSSYQVRLRIVDSGDVARTVMEAIARTKPSPPEPP